MRIEVTEGEKRYFDLTVTEIKGYIKNRYPLLMLDRVSEIVEGKSARGFKNFTYNEWFFPAHFEDNPNVPGVVTLEVMIEIFILSFMTLPECLGEETADSKIDNLRFLRPITPGDKLEVQAELKKFSRGIATGSVVGQVDGKKVCSCDLVVCVPKILKGLSPSSRQFL